MTAGVSWIRELLCDAPIYGLSLPPRDYRICDIRFIYLSVSVARYLDRPNIMRVSKRTRSTRETFDFAVNLSETRELHPFLESWRIQRGVQTSPIRSKKANNSRFLHRGIAFLGGNNDCNSQNLVYGNSRKEDFEKLWRDHIRLFGVEKINAITAATLLTQPQYDTRASLST